MIVWLSLLVCSASGACHVTVPRDEPFIGLTACQTEAMRFVPQWERMHPGMVVSKMRCTIGKKPDADDNA